MSIDVTLEPLRAAAAAIGRGAVLISVDSSYDPDAGPVEIGDCVRWDRSGPLYLAHLGNTEGNIEFSAEVAMSELTFPEYTGPVAHERYYDGESVTATIPLFFADPRLRAVCSPTGVASGGYGRQRKVREHTLVVVPEQLLYDEATDEFADLTWDAGNGWQVGGTALTDRQEALLGVSMWFWRGSWGRQLPPFAHADGGKTVNPCEFMAMYAPEFPDANRIYTIGDPADVQINLDGEGS
jgi:hypothetical protein